MNNLATIKLNIFKEDSYFPEESVSIMVPYIAAVSSCEKSYYRGAKAIITLSCGKEYFTDSTKSEIDEMLSLMESNTEELDETI